MKKIPHTFTIVFFLILAAAVVTWIVPGGEFVRETITVNGSQRMVVVNDSFHYKDIKKLFTLLKKKNLLKLKERLDDSVFEPAKEKFSSLMEKTPQFVLRVPSIYIASYLGITPETLSRIRAKMKIDERNV